MAKKMNRFLALVLVACMCVSALPLQALAAEVTTETSTEISPEGLTTDVTTTTTTDTDENGNTIVTVTIEKSTKGTTEDGVDVDRKESSTTTTVANADGEELGETWTEEGSETKEWTEKDTGNAAGQPDVTVELKPGETVEVTVKGDAISDTTGDEPEDPDDKEYDYTKTTNEVDRTVTGTLTEGEVTASDVVTDVECPVKPEDYEGKNYNTHPVNKNDPDPDGLFTDTCPDYGTTDEDKPDEEGYDFQLSGYGDGTEAAVPVFMNIVYMRDENGDPIPDGNGGFVIDEEKSQLVYAGSKAGYTGMYNQSLQIVLKNEDGEYFYTYCIDAVTETVPESWYKITNLEDNDYYSEESASKIRAIVENGYWGTDATVYETNEDGTVKVDAETGKPIPQKDAEGNIVVDETTVGSLAKIKALLEAYAEENPTVTVQDENGNDQTYVLADLIDGLKEHEALAVTQAAIWSYSNGCVATMNGEDGIAVVGVQSTIKCFNSNSALRQYIRDYDLESDARMKALYECMLSLEPVDDTDEGVTTIVNENNFIEDVSLTVHDKVEDHENNADEDTDNDVYNVDLNFTLAFVPDPETDDLLVYLTDANGDPINDKDGNPIVRRLAGENSEDRSAEAIVADENGVYTLTGLQLGENSDFVFDLRLEGTQYLENGVYVYTSHGGRESSQTLVGLAQGNHSVDVSASMTITFNVDDSNHVVAERHWSDESDPIEIPDEEPPAEDDDPPEEFRLGPDDGVEEIPDEIVPLADAPTTGDNSGLWLVMIMMAAAVLYVVNVISKKRQHDAF